MGGLKKVDRSQMTHKNPELRNRAPVPFKSNASSYKPVGLAAKKAVKKPAKFDLEDGKKWIIEYQEGAKLTIEDSNMKQVVYIYKCENSTVLIDGKVNSVILDSCKKVGLVFNAVVAGSEVVNCQSVKIQARGQCPTISIDKTDGCLVYMGDECLDCQIVSAKSSEMNISIPREDGDYDEHPVAEQFRSHYDAKKKTIVIEAIPEPRQGPVDSAYAQMIAQSSNPMAVLLLAENIKRPKRQAETEIAAEAVEEVEPKTEIAEPAPIVNEAYAKRLEGSAIYLALKLSGGSRKTVDHAGGYGRKKRQAITFEEEAIMQQIFPVQDEINEIEQTTSLIIKPKIKAWGETGLVKNNN